MLNHHENEVNAREEKFREIMTKAIVCQSEAFPVFKHCLRNNLKDYVPKQYLIVTTVNLGSTYNYLIYLTFFGGSCCE